MEIELSKCLPDEPFYLVDFCGENFTNLLPQGNYLIGPEGGFSETEREQFFQKSLKAFKFNGNLVLKSETAVISIAALVV
jgi:RsmE family RNA methyltransferase